MNTESMYTALGITPAVHRFGEEVLAGLRARFDEIDRVAEYNQCKVIGAMQKNRVDATHFAATTTPGATISSASMPTASTRKPRSCGRRSPAARTR